MDATPRSLRWLTLGVMLLPAAALPGQAAPEAAELVARLADPAQRARARAALVAQGAGAVGALVGLVRRADADQAHATAALETLAEIGPEAVAAVPALCEVCAGLPRPMQQVLFSALERIWPYDAGFWAMSEAELSQVLAPMTGNLRDRRQAMRAATMSRGLRNIRQLGVEPGMVEGLIGNLRFAKPGDPVQDYILDALRRLGPRAAAAAPRLRQQFRFPVPKRPAVDKEPRYLRVVEALLAIAPQAPEAAAAQVYVMIYHPDPARRRRAAMALGHHGEAAGPVVAEALVALRDPDVAVVREVVTSLGMVGPAARAAEPALTELTQHADTQVAGRAKAALRQIRRQ